MDQFAIRVMIADDHPAIISGIVAALANHTTVKVVATASNSTELVAALNTHPCDVLVSDYAMPGGEFGDGVTLFSFLRRRYPDTRIVVLTMMNNPGTLRSLMKLDIHCILSKSDSTDHVLTAIQGAFASGRYFSPSISDVAWQIHMEARNTASGALTMREEEVVRLFVSGLSVSEIAEQLKRSKQTISSQKTSAMKKLGLDSDTDLVKYVMGVSLAASGDASSPAQSNLKRPLAR
ncbi:LuxR family transcriptional regulator [Burkholderia sp. MSMB1078WGS]|uniref:response regulator transcription factor n=1 Tax=Burkholderia sp. MSMB1078WGS TaxID=1637900 RepID=UPI0007538081|nr:response regulator transcription factor [Burkholderia sp. MSMB1078WGS]KVT11372.1 LuxR family transcriptional regulator [Burkholderia sp. MSMB1078WGS]